MRLRVRASPFPSAFVPSRRRVAPDDDHTAVQRPSLRNSAIEKWRVATPAISTIQLFQRRETRDSKGCGPTCYAGVGSDWTSPSLMETTEKSQRGNPVETSTIYTSSKEISVSAGTPSIVLSLFSDLGPFLTGHLHILDSFLEGLPSAHLSLGSSQMIPLLCTMRNDEIVTVEAQSNVVLRWFSLREEGREKRRLRRGSRRRKEFDDNV